MKNSAFVIAFTTVLLFPSFLIAQRWEPEKSFKETFAYGCDPAESGFSDNPSCGVVIALSGLKLRAKPSFEAKTLALIPFGATVQRTEKGYDLRPAEWNDVFMTPDSTPGYWQEINWMGKKGFAFSAFIGDAIHRMNDDGYLLFEDGGGCWNDCYASPSYHYYGIFTNRDSSRWDLKKIKPSFIFQDYIFFGTSVKSDSKQRTAFIIAMKNPLNEGLLLVEKAKKTVYQRDYQSPESNRNKKVNIGLSPFSLSITSFQNEESTLRHRLLLTEKSSGRKQTLLTEITVDQIALIWSGDLDQDGIMDFMLSYSNDHLFGCQLFLSSFAKGKQLVKPIKIYWYGDCC